MFIERKLIRINKCFNNLHNTRLTLLMSVLSFLPSNAELAIKSHNAKLASPCMSSLIVYAILMTRRKKKTNKSLFYKQKNICNNRRDLFFVDLRSTWANAQKTLRGQ